MTQTSPKSIAMQGIQGPYPENRLKMPPAFVGEVIYLDPSFFVRFFFLEVLVVIGILGGVTGISTDTYYSNNASKNQQKHIIS